jgi:hypothetical protein
MPPMPSRPRLVATAAAWSALALGALVAAFSLPIDDFWLSLRSADAIRAGADLGRAIDLTWTPMLPGAINPQWAAQLVLDGPGGAGGLGWALAVNAALVGAGLGLTAVRVRRRAGAAATAIAMLLVIGALAPHLLARAASFSIALLPALLLLLDRRPARPWLPLAVAVLMIAWANLHGAFVIGQVAVGVSLVVELRAWRNRDPAARPATLALATGVALLAPLANPAGFELIRYAYAQPGLDIVRSISVEWQPAWPWIPVATLAWILVAVLVAARIARRGAITLRDALLGLGLGALALTSIRNIPWLVLALAPVLAEDVEAALRARPGLATAVGEVRGSLGGPRAWVAVLAALVLAVAFQPLRPALREPVARLTPDAPVAIADFLDERLPRGEAARILNEQVWGGYLAWRLGDRIETAMDGRLEIRDRETWISYFALLHGDGDPDATLARAGVTWVAVREHRGDLIYKLRLAGWQVALSAPEGLLLNAPR